MMRTVLRALFGLLGSLLGTVGVLALLLAMNGVDRRPPKPPAKKALDIRVAPQPRPESKPRPKPRPRKTPPRRASPTVPTLAAGVGGLDLGLLGGGGLDLGDAASSLLGEETDVMTADSVDALPVPTKQVAASYPSRARTKGITGEVVLLLSVNARGQLVDVEVQSARPPGVFEEAALQSVRQWTFAPGTYQGRAVTVTEVPLPVVFDLER